MRGEVLWWDGGFFHPLFRGLFHGIRREMLLPRVPLYFELYSRYYFSSFANRRKCVPWYYSRLYAVRFSLVVFPIVTCLHFSFSLIISLFFIFEKIFCTKGLCRSYIYVYNKFIYVLSPYCDFASRSIQNVLISDPKLLSWCLIMD